MPQSNRISLHNPPVEHSPDKKMRILIVDRDPAVRSVIRNCLLRQSAKDIHETDSGAAVRNLLRNYSFDCIFLESVLADMDAVTLLQEIYNAEADLGLAPCVILAAPGDDSAMVEALRHGAQDYVLKDHLSAAAISTAMAKARELFELKSIRNHAQLQLQATRRMESVGHLTSGVAHDFNNLLTVVLGNTRLLRRKMDKGQDGFNWADADKKVEAIEQAALKGAELVRRLMMFARQSALSEEVQDINACMQETVALLGHTIGETITIQVYPGKNLWPVLIDARELENALINLAVNARDAMPRGGKLTFETANVFLDEIYTMRYPDVSPGPYVMIAVSDTGFGIAPQVMRHIFEPFFTTKERGEGTGLGLSVVYGFIKQSKGHINVYSEPGHGTVFRIYLQRYCDGVESEEILKPPPIQDGRETVLVVEDDEDIRLITVNMLEKLGYHAIQAANGRLAMDIFKKDHHGIDLVLTDIVMPGGINGIELVEQMRAIQPGVRVLYTSGFTRYAIPDYQVPAGAELISKPYHRDALAEKVRKVLDGKTI